MNERQPSLFVSLLLAITPAIAILGLQGCPSAGTVPPNVPPDATDAAHAPDASMSTFNAACDGMRRAGCVVLDDCASVLAQTQGDVRFKQYNLTCLAQALTASDVNACNAPCTPVDQ